jgi:mono/diheme cytochrome c family protein
MRKVLTGLGAVIVLVVVVFAVYVASRQHLKFDRPYPAVAASTDTAVVARGRYVVRRLANCAACHGDPKQMERNLEGEEVPLSGGFAFKIPPGEFFVRNITPDPETGIGRFSDGEIARALRHGVGHDGRALLPFMEMQGLSDEDLTAVVSYLRSQPPVQNLVPNHRPNLLGNIVMATALANPVGPKETPPQASPHGATVENGRYLAESVTNCWACHTQRDMKTGALTGPRFGGAHMPDDYNPKRMWAPPNLTNDPATGRLAKFTEDEFVARIHQGRVLPGSPMPWQGFKNMDDDDLRAIYRYLESLPPVVNDVGPPYVDKP